MTGIDKKRLKNVLLHLRLPFSFFLLPVFMFALSQSIAINIPYTVNIFISLHFFIYPASNSYNSFMDKDTGSIGLLKNPPPATRDLFYASIILDVVGILLLSLISIWMIPLAIVYTAVSRAYSWTGIRLKKKPVAGWLVVIIFQGAYTYMLVSMAAGNNISLSWFTSQNIEAMLISTLLIGAYYPLTQVYQHEEDGRRGDRTISLKLGIKNTFLFSTIMFMISFAVIFHYMNRYYSIEHFLIFLGMLIPAIGYFLIWMIRVFKSTDLANYNNAMRMTMISSTGLIIAFTVLTFLNH